MKLNYSILAVIAAAGILFSCEKDNALAPAGNGTDNQEQTGTEQPASTGDGSILLSFGATLETPLSSRVSIGNENDGKRKLSFEDGDMVLVVSGGATKEYEYDASKTQFVPVTDGIAMNAEVEVYYPAGEFALVENDVVFTMPAAVTSLDDLGAKNPLAAQISGNDTDGYSATFKAVASILQVGVTADVNINTVMLNFGDSNKYAENAKFSIGWSEGAPTMVVSEQGGTSGVIVNVSPAKTAEAFFILPTVALSEGLEVTANLAENHNGGTNSYLIKNESTAAPVRNTISKMSFYAGLFSGGTGTSEDPYIIAKARDFKYIDTYCTSGYGSLTASDFLAAHYQQTADIDFKNAQIAPIGDNTNRFTGYYDGNNKELKNVKIEEDGQYAAVFANVQAGEIKNLTVSGNITKIGTTTNSHAAGIAGIIGGTAAITGCTNNATITSAATYTGGIVGRIYASGNSVADCVNNGAVTSSTSFVGGITGQHVNGGTIINCTNQGAVSGTQYVGGIAGQVRAGSTLNGVHNLTGGNVTGTQYVGGIAGCVGAGEGRTNGGNTTKVINARVDGANVTATTSDNVCQVGGIVGVVWPSAHIQGCIAVNGTVKGYKTVGGAIGQVDYAVSGSTSVGKNRILVAECLAGMNVVNNGDNADARIAGFLGHYLTSSAGRNEYVFVYQNGVIGGSITAENCDYVGTFVGRVSAKGNATRIWDSYSLLEDSDYNITTDNTHIGGFVSETSTAGYNHCYFCVTENDPGTISGITKISKSEIRSQTLAANTPNTASTITLGEWQNPDDVNYPVPGSLVTFGYYK